MKSLILSIILIFSQFFPAFASQQLMLGQLARNNTGGAGAYTDIVFDWDAESTTANKIDAASSTMTLDGTASISSTYAAVGTNSLKIPGGTASYAINSGINAGGIDESQGAIGFYAYVDSASPGNNIWGKYTYGANDNISMAEAAGYNYYVYKANSAGVTVYGNRPTAQQWVYVEYRWKSGGLDAGANTIELRHDNVVVDSSTTALNTFQGDITTFQIGAYSSGANDIYIDQIRITNDPDTRRLYDLKDTTISW